MRVWLAGRPLWALFRELLVQPAVPRFATNLPTQTSFKFPLTLVTSLLQVTVLTLELDSPTLPEGRTIVFDLKDTARLADTKKNPIVIKEGVEYKFVPLIPWLRLFRELRNRPHQCTHYLQSQPFNHICKFHFSKLV